MAPGMSNAGLRGDNSCVIGKDDQRADEQLELWVDYPWKSITRHPAARVEIDRCITDFLEVELQVLRNIHVC